MASLPRRLEALRVALRALEAEPNDRARRHSMLRRVHALAAAARVLGFDSVGEVLGEAERALRRSARPGNQHAAFQDISRALDLLPSLVLGTAAVPRAGAELGSAPTTRGYPISVLVFGTQSLADALSSGDASLEVERVEDVARATELMRSLGPDAAVVDADRGGARELVEQLLSDPQIERVPLLVLGSFAGPEAASVFVKLGAERVLPKPVSAETLRRTLFELHDLASSPGATREPVGELTVSALADRIATEVRRGLIESLELGGESTAVDFGDGADVLGAVWGAVARVRELVTVRSSGTVRFQPLGPEGAIPLAPWTSEDRRAGERGARNARSGEDVTLKGRRIVVADDDPAVVWFMLGLFRAVGAEVVEAHDGNRALERVFETSPDLVVSDVLMPARDGFSLCHEIKRDVVARDVPVILLSWKEDLLQRVRELGADADGYLRKEAAASTVVERVREVLRPRARVEQRLSAGGEARGRLDGITPHFVLDIVCRTTPDATLTVRDAVYLYEVQVRGGRVRSVTRSASDGDFERGERVLACLLGVNAGRFTVKPDHAPCRSDFNLPTAALLAAPIRRARAALAAVSAERLPQVVSIGIDREAIGRYLECTPEPARKLIDELGAGASPRELLMGGKVSPRLLESLLSDLARRGGVVHVEREQGAVPGITGDAPEPPPPAQAAAAPAAGIERDTAWSDADAQHAVLEMAASSEAVSDVSVAAPAVSEAPLGSNETVASAAFEATSDAAADPGWFSFALDASGGLGMPPVAPVETATRLEGPPTPAPPASEPKALENSLSAESISVFEALTAEPSDSSQARSAEPPDVHQALTAEPPDAHQALTAEPPDARQALTAEPLADAESLAVAAERESSPLPVAQEVPRELTPRGGLTAPLEHTLVVAALDPAPRPSTAPWPFTNENVDRLNQTLPLGTHATRPGPRPVLRLPEDDAPSPSIADVFAALSSDEQPPTAAFTNELPPPSAPPASDEQPPTAHAPAPVFASADATRASASADATPIVQAQTRTARLDAAVAAAAQAETAALAPAPPPAPESPRTPPPQADAPSSEAEPAPEVAEAANLPAHDATLVSLEAPAERGRARSDAVPTTDIGPVSPPEPTSSSRAASTRRTRRDASGVLRTLGLAGVAFGAAFILVRFVIVPQFRAHEVPPPALSPSALVAAAEASAALASAAPVLQLRTEILAISPDMPVRAGEGVLEIVTSREDLLYVDGVAIGRGPRKPVSFAPGRHELKVVRGEQTGSLNVEIAAGWRTRITVDPIASEPSP